MLRLSILPKFLALSLAAIFVLAACERERPVEPTAPPAEEAAPAVEEEAIVSEEMEARPQPGTQEDLEATAGSDRVFFAFDRYDLTPEARATAERQAEWLREYPSVTVTIEGHADERGTREYNLALGDRRATAVKNYLVALGISPSRISTISYGKERPAVLGSNEEAWAQNRRAVTVID